MLGPVVLLAGDGLVKLGVEELEELSAATAATASSARCASPRARRPRVVRPAQRPRAMDGAMRGSGGTVRGGLAVGGEGDGMACGAPAMGCRCGEVGPVPATMAAARGVCVCVVSTGACVVGAGVCAGVGIRAAGSCSSWPLGEGPGKSLVRESSSKDVSEGRLPASDRRPGGGPGAQGDPYEVVQRGRHMGLRRVEVSQRLLAREQAHDAQPKLVGVGGARGGLLAPFPRAFPNRVSRRASRWSCPERSWSRSR